MLSSLRSARLGVHHAAVSSISPALLPIAQCGSNSSRNCCFGDSGSCHRCAGALCHQGFSVQCACRIQGVCFGALLFANYIGLLSSAMVRADVPVLLTYRMLSFPTTSCLFSWLECLLYHQRIRLSGCSDAVWTSYSI